MVEVVSGVSDAYFEILGLSVKRVQQVIDDLCSSRPLLEFSLFLSPAVLDVGVGSIGSAGYVAAPDLF